MGPRLPGLLPSRPRKDDFLLGVCCGNLPGRHCLGYLGQEKVEIDKQYKVSGITGITTGGVLRSIILFSLLTLLSGLLTSVMPVFPAFVLAWWTVGVAAVANFTVAFVWTIELAAGPR